MSNVAGKAYAMNVITPVPPGWTWLQRLIFMFARAFPGTLSGLLGLELIHFARWVLIKRDQWPAGQLGKPSLKHDYMLFCSNFNGTWDQYIDAFADGIPNGLNLFWYTSLNYPQSIPITPFKDYITLNQFHTNYYYNATPGSGQRDIKCALKVYAELKSLTACYAGNPAPETFAAEYRKALARMQNCLGSPGYAPVASLDTEAADRNRAAFVIAQAEKTRKLKAAQHAAPAAAPPAPQAATPKIPANTFDGGHCFFTALLPIRTEDVVDNDGLRSSPVHMVRDALAILPTAHQSPVTEQLPVDSPFARCRKTHFVRMAVIDDVIFNGRMASDAILDGSDRTIAKPVDELPNPYLMLVIDFDAPQGSHAELRRYLKDIWTMMGIDLDPVFSGCFGYSERATNADGFADYMLSCQVETTMPFNDYWALGSPPLPSLSKWWMVAIAVAAASAAIGIIYCGFAWLDLIVPKARFCLFVLEILGIVVAGVVASIPASAFALYRLVMSRGRKPFPMAPNSDLKSILKGLYLQRELIAFASKVQGMAPGALHAAFSAFLAKVNVNDLDAPTQAPGTIRP